MNSDIKYIKGNIFTSKHQTLVNTVNCVGVMGAGIALEFKYRYPEMFEKYSKLCDDKLIQIGKLWIYDIPNSNQKVLNFPTKYHWKYPSKYEYLEKGLENFLRSYKEKGIQSIAFPLLGAQNGGLDSEKVKDLMYKYFAQTDIPIEIYEYDEYAEDGLIDKFRSIFIYNNTNEATKITHFNNSIILKLKKVLEENNINSLIQLNDIKGIGKETISYCFQLAMRLNNESKYVSYELYPNENNNSKISHASESDQTYSKQQIESNKNVQTLKEKVQLTGLDEQTILGIEQKNEDVSIKALKEYCKALKINFKDFLMKNYVPKRNSRKRKATQSLTLPL